MPKQPRRTNSLGLFLILGMLLLGLLVVLGVSLGRQITSSPSTSVNRPATAPPLPDPLAAAQSNQPGLRVLFIGNSYTFVNNLPELVRQLSASESPPLIPVMQAKGGYQLQQHAQDPDVATLLKQVRWDIVVLQEQSQLPSFDEEFRSRQMYPFAYQLNQEIQQIGAKTLLFMTWGYRDGDRRNLSTDTYTAMQARLQDGYTRLSRQLSAPIVPVGLAWAEALKRQPGLDLWDGDGSHPSLKGSYLAACVFYSVLYDRNPMGNPFTADLPASEAEFLQEMAAIATGKKA